VCIGALSTIVSMGVKARIADLPTVQLVFTCLERGQGWEEDWEEDGAYMPQHIRGHCGKLRRARIRVFAVGSALKRNVVEDLPKRVIF
jgi:hypothetical protein